MREVSSKVRLLGGDTVYEVTSVGKALSTTILADSFHKMKVQSNCLNANFLNHWIDYDEISNNEVSLSTQLDNNESTINDYKSSVVGPDLHAFYDNMIPVVKAFLVFAYYMERSKEWNTPIDPLNLIYTDNGFNNEGNVKAFYHSDTTINDLGPDFLNSVIKMVTYLLDPEETSSASEYFDKTAQDYYDDINENADYVAKYGQEDMEWLGDTVYNIQLNDVNERINSVKDMFHSLGDDITPQKIEDSEGVVNSTLANNLADYLSPAQQAAQEAQLKKEQAEKAAQEAAANDPKLKKQAELKRREEERKQKQAELKKQQKEERQQRELEKQQRLEKTEEERKQKEADAEAKRKQNEADAQAKRDKAKQDAENKRKQREADDKAKREKREADKKARDQAKLDRLKNKKARYDTWPWYKRPWAISAYVVIGIGCTIGIGVAWHNHNVKVAEEQVAKIRNAKNPEKSPYFSSGATASGAQNYKAAAPDFDKFFAAGGKLSDLNNNQIGSVFAAYLNTGQYQKILDNIGIPQTATALVNYLTGKKDLKQVNNLQSKLTIITLVKAIINDDYQGVTQQANNVDVSQNGVLQLDICKAYAKTKKLADGKTWAKAQKNSDTLIKAIKTYALNNGIKESVINKEMD